MATTGAKASSGGLLKLADQVERLASRVDLVAHEIKKQVATVILTDLANVTPVDTGEALSNWQVSLSGPATSKLRPYFPSPKGHYVKDVWTHRVAPEVTSQANIPPTLEAGKGMIESSQPGQAIYITNNAPQIGALDAGHSNQAPVGFIDRAVILGRSVAAKAKVSVSKIVNS